MIVLGIESSCDETAAGVLTDGRRIVSSVVASQDAIHAPYGGVVPELASRRHLEVITPVIAQALRDAGVTLAGLDGIAVTQGPGLVGSLLVGCSVAKSLAWVHRKPLVGVNHLEGHIYASFLTEDPPEHPFLALVVSGGHTALYHARRPREDALGGQTPDAAGGAPPRYQARRSHRRCRRQRPAPRCARRRGCRARCPSSHPSATALHRQRRDDRRRRDGATAGRRARVTRHERHPRPHPRRMNAP